jgi:hypothetical protein
MFDPKKVKLGAKPPRIDKRTLQFAKYAATLPPPPPSCDWTKGVTSFGMMDNDTLGDCTCAAVGHGIQVASLNTPEGEVTPADQKILELYQKSCGYVPGDPSTDNGGVIIDVLNYNRQFGLGKFKRDGKKKIANKFRLYAYADPAVSNLTHIKQSIATFGMVDIGINLPLTAQAQTGTGVWDVVGNPNVDPNSFPNSWGGHSVVVVAYDAATVTCITWGQLQKMSLRFWNCYVTEAHALLFHPWLNRFAGNYPTALAQLESDLAAVTG